ncbi:MAG: zinc ribbon domain-containing protein [Planctomycetes bacterium]|nr:zinc ribbon domain-containing protein [Planctomycetota bacterium]
MPLYEYVCLDCQTPFEALVVGDAKPECPRCKSRRLEKQFSTFAVNARAGAKAPPRPGPCRTCGDPRGPGACSLG